MIEKATRMSLLVPPAVQQPKEEEKVQQKE